MQDETVTQEEQETTSSPPDFRELMSAPLDNFPDRPLLPTGHYYGVILRAEHGQGGQNNNHFWAFICQPREPAEDVKPELMDGINLRDYEFPTTGSFGIQNGPGKFWITPAAMKVVRGFVASCKFPTTRPLDEFIENCRGTPVLLGISRETSERTGREYNTFVSLAGDPR